jgi:TolB protein
MPTHSLTRISRLAAISLALLAATSCTKERKDDTGAGTNEGKLPVSTTGSKPDVPTTKDKPIPSASAEKPDAGQEPPKSDEIPPEERQKIAGKIAFISERDGNREIYVIGADGKGEERLTKSPFSEYNGPASPDGTALLVIRVEGEEGPQQLLLQPLDGSPPKPLGPLAGRVRFPTFSPDGRFVVYESDGGKVAPAHFSDIYRVGSDGSGFRRLTENPEGNFEPSFSPKGDAIVFLSSRDRVAELYRMRPDGKDAVRLTNTPRDEWGARYSPDGKVLVFVSDREGADRVWLMPSSGGEARRLTQMRPAPRIVEDRPTWSPTGKRIAYVLRAPDEPSRVGIVAMEDGKETFVRGPGGAEQVNEPAWSPDGQYLAVTVTRGSAQQLWIVRADGSGMTKLTSSPGGNWNPIWIPPSKGKVGK